MVYLAKCPVCKTEQNGYDWVRTPKGKKWLRNKDGVWHSCPMTKNKNNSKPSFGSIVKLTFNDYEFCDLCGNHFYKKSTKEKYKNIHGDTLTEHLKKFHKNNELLDEVDFMVLTDQEKEEKRSGKYNRCNTQKPKGKYILKNKFVIKT